MDLVLVVLCFFVPLREDNDPIAPFLGLSEHLCVRVYFLFCLPCPGLALSVGFIMDDLVTLGLSCCTHHESSINICWMNKRTRVEHVHMEKLVYTLKREKASAGIPGRTCLFIWTNVGRRESDVIPFT